MAEFLRKTGGAKPVFWNYEILRDMQTRKLFLFSPHLLHIIVIPPCKKITLRISKGSPRNASCRFAPPNSSISPPIFTLLL